MYCIKAMGGYLLQKEKKIPQRIDFNLQVSAH